MDEPCIRYVRTLIGTNMRATLIYDVGRTKLSEFDPYHLRHHRIATSTYDDAQDVPDMGPKAWRSLAARMERRWKLLRGRKTDVFRRVCSLCRQRADEVKRLAA